MTKPGLTPMRRWQMKVSVDAPSGCWRWTAAVGDHGYARFKIGDTLVAAHRWGYEQFVGAIPEGLSLDHLCHTRDVDGCLAAGYCTHRRCVNPAHLEPVTHTENVRRGAKRRKAA